MRVTEAVREAEGHTESVEVPPVGQWVTLGQAESVEEALALRETLGVREGEWEAEAEVQVVEEVERVGETLALRVPEAVALGQGERVRFPTLPLTVWERVGVGVGVTLPQELALAQEEVEGQRLVLRLYNSDAADDQRLVLNAGVGAG